MTTTSQYTHSSTQNSIDIFNDWKLVHHRLKSTPKELYTTHYLE